MRGASGAWAAVVLSFASPVAAAESAPRWSDTIFVEVASSFVPVANDVPLMVLR